MHRAAVATDIVAGGILGMAGYALILTGWPCLAGTTTLFVAVAASIAGMLFRAPYGSLRPSFDRYLGIAASRERRFGRHWTLDQVLHADLIQVTVSPAVLRVALAWVLSGLALALLAPALDGLGIELRRWMAWTIILLTIAVSVGLKRARRR